jgi:hypothetical protein
MKRFIIILACSIIVIVASCFIYFNSRKYKYKLAREERDENLNKMNNIPRLYIPEGVYLFDSYRTNHLSSRDKFGVKVYNTTTSYNGTGEISFTSNKVTIVLNDKREEISLGEPYITYLGNGYIEYNFPIVRWTAYKSDKCFFSYDSIENGAVRRQKEYFKGYKGHLSQPTLTLNIETVINDGIKRNDAFVNIYLGNMEEYIESKNIKNEDVKNTLKYIDIDLRMQDNPPDWTTYPAGFRIVPSYNLNGIPLNNLKYSYNYNPKYVNAKYDADEYDINVALDRVKRSGYKNPFIRNYKWK